MLETIDFSNMTSKRMEEKKTNLIEEFLIHRDVYIC